MQNYMGRVNTIGNSKMQQGFSRNFSQKGLIENIGLKHQTVPNIVEDMFCFGRKRSLWNNQNCPEFEADETSWIKIKSHSNRRPLDRSQFLLLTIPVTRLAFSRRINLRCLHLSQNNSRNQKTQTRNQNRTSWTSLKEKPNR